MTPEIKIPVLKVYTLDEGTAAILELLRIRSTDTWRKFWQAFFNNDPTYRFEELNIEKIEIVLKEMIPQMYLGEVYSLKATGIDLRIKVTPQAWMILS